MLPVLQLASAWGLLAAVLPARLLEARVVGLPGQQ
jgi:hypothetical protein